MLVLEKVVNLGRLGKWGNLLRVFRLSVKTCNSMKF